MGGESIRARIRRLSKAQGYGGRPDHNWGVPTEVIRQQWREMPTRIAERAFELWPSYQRGDPLTDPLDRVSGLEVQAHIVLVAAEYGVDKVPPEWAENIEVRRSSNLPEWARKQAEELAGLVIRQALHEYKEMRTNNESEAT